MFLGVTDLQADAIQMTSLCARWQVQRHATAYRIVLESRQGECDLPPTPLPRARVLCASYCG